MKPGARTAVYGLLAGVVGGLFANNLNSWAFQPRTLNNVFSADIVDAGDVQANRQLSIGALGVSNSLLTTYVSSVDARTKLAINTDIITSGSLVLGGTSTIGTGDPSYSILSIGYDFGQKLLTLQQNPGFPATSTPVSVASFDIDGYLASTTPSTWAMYVNAITTTGAEYGGVSVPHDVLVTAVSIDVSAAGIGGVTATVITVTDGLSTCDCPFPCDTPGGIYSLSCSGNCLISASTAVKFFVSDIGDCAVGPTILGNVLIEYLWQ